MRRPAGGSEKSTNVSIGSFRSASFVVCFLDKDDEDGDEGEDEIGLSCSTFFFAFLLSQPPMQHGKIREKEKRKKEEKKEKTRKEETEELSE